MSNEKIREYHRQYRAANKLRQSCQDSVIREENRLKLLQFVGNSICKDCGNDDVRVLQFDHLRDKVANVSKFLTRNYSKAIEEALKCEVVCANCHVIRTRARMARNIEAVTSNWVRLSKTHCPNGHEKIPENRYLIKNGTTSVCRICRADRHRKQKQLKKDN